MRERSRARKVWDEDSQVVIDRSNYYWTALGILVEEGFPLVEMQARCWRWMDAERDWPAGTDAYRIMFEIFMGEDIYHRRKQEGIE